MRLFIALPVPPEVAQPLGHLRLSLPGARWLDPADMHITLAFLGEVARADAEEMAEAMAEIRSPVFRLKINRLDAFSSGDKARILWAGLDEREIPELFALQKKVMSRLRELGFDLDHQRYRPHITLARLKQTSTHGLAVAMDGASAPHTPSWEAREMAIYESRLNPSGARYTPLLHLPFAQP